MGRKKKSGRDMLIPDPLLLSRLNKYLDSKRHETTIDQNKMIEDLRLNYKEYEKKDKTAFRASVFRAYNSILQPLINPSSIREVGEDGDCEEIDDIESSCSDEEVLDSDDMINEQDIQLLHSKTNSEKERNNVNSSYMQTLQGMTNSSSRNTSRNGSEKGSNGKKSPVMDAIDISSDDEDDRRVDVSNMSNNQPPVALNRNLLPYQITKSNLPTVCVNKNFGKSLSTRVLNIPSNPLSISIVAGTGGTSRTVSSSISECLKSFSTPKKRVAESPLFVNNKKRKTFQMVEDVPKLRLKDFGGYQKIEQSLKCLLQHLKYPDVYCQLGISPPTGFLLHGPPGTGKTLLAHCIAGELSLPLIKVVGTELVTSLSGESESKIRSLFDSAAASSPCVLFIDEIDAISQPRELASKDMERRIVTQLLSSFDDLHERENADVVIVIGATNRADSLDPALRRAGRFDREIIVGMPDRDTRTDILRLLCDSLKLSPELDLSSVACLTPGYVGADLKALSTQAAYQAVDRFMKAKEQKEKVDSGEKTGSPEENKTNEATIECTNDNEKDLSNNESIDKTDNDKEIITVNETSESICIESEGEKETLEKLFIEYEDFVNALKLIQPSSKREGFATVPDVTWSDVGSLDNIREQLNLSIMMPVKYPEEFAKLGVTSPTGVLLCGPPGCGKTLLAKAVANEANINFISVKGPELLNMYVGESEKAVRQVFQRARNSQPCVIFFDEMDALCPKRSGSDGGGRAGSRVVNQLLTEMDGVEGGRGGVYMMAATNRPDMLDPAILRPGRFDKILYVGLPTPEDRSLILKAITKNGTKPDFTDEVDLDVVGSSEKCEGFSGADLSALIKEASVQALSEYIKNNREGQLKVSNKHINFALAKIKPSVSPEERIRYEAYRLLYSSKDPSEEKMEEDD